jgi:uncharacterized protein YjbI with pentapeptide repeats
MTALAFRHATTLSLDRVSNDNDAEKRNPLSPVYIEVALISATVTGVLSILVIHGGFLVANYLPGVVRAEVSREQLSTKLPAWSAASLDPWEVQNPGEASETLKVNYDSDKDEDIHLRQVDRDVEGASMQGGNYRFMEASEVFLVMGDFRASSLAFADLERANLRESKLDGADLTGADLRGADLRFAADVRQQQMLDENSGSYKALTPGTCVTPTFTTRSGADGEMVYSSVEPQKNPGTKPKLGEKVSETLRIFFKVPPGELLYDSSHPDQNRITLKSSLLADAHLEDSFLAGANLAGACLASAWLNRAVLSKVCFNDADLKGAHLNGAHLEGADLTNADLSGADLSGADLTGTVNLLLAKNWSARQLCAAKLDSSVQDQLKCQQSSNSPIRQAQR